MIRFLSRLARRSWRAYRARRRRAAYVAYLRSPEWQVVRLQVLKRDRYQCTRCGDTQSLEVHHLHYENFKHERLSDLVTVCHTCHKQADRERRQATRRSYAR